MSRVAGIGSIVSMTLVLVVAGCSSEQPKSVRDTPANVKLAVATGNLPVCNNGHDGEIWYVWSEGKFYVCSGTASAWVATDLSGYNPLVGVSPLGPGPECSSGGVSLSFGPDTNRNNQLDDVEVMERTSLCNGAPGADGADGAPGAHGDPGAQGLPGTAGLNSLVALDTEPPGATCPEGGVKISTGLDIDGDGVLAATEVTQTRSVCNGASASTDCIPSCAGKACGEDDGCGERCPGSCGSGLRCEAGACVCDAASCGGCCSEGQCLDGTTAQACGSAGNTCVACLGGQVCVDGVQCAQAGTGAACTPERVQALSEQATPAIVAALGGLSSFCVPQGSTSSSGSTLSFCTSAACDGRSGTCKGTLSEVMLQSDPNSQAISGSAHISVTGAAAISLTGVPLSCSDLDIEADVTVASSGVATTVEGDSVRFAPSGVQVKVDSIEVLGCGVLGFVADSISGFFRPQIESLAADVIEQTSAVLSCAD